MVLEQCLALGASLTFKGADDQVHINEYWELPSQTRIARNCSRDKHSRYHYIQHTTTIARFDSPSGA